MVERPYLSHHSPLPPPSSDPPGSSCGGGGTKPRRLGLKNQADEPSQRKIRQKAISHVQPASHSTSQPTNQLVTQPGTWPIHEVGGALQISAASNGHGLHALVACALKVSTCPLKVYRSAWAPDCMLWMPSGTNPHQNWGSVPLMRDLQNWGCVPRQERRRFDPSTLKSMQRGCASRRARNGMPPEPPRQNCIVPASVNNDPFCRTSDAWGGRRVVTASSGKPDHDHTKKVGLDSAVTSAAAMARTNTLLARHSLAKPLRTGGASRGATRDAP